MNKLYTLIILSLLQLSLHAQKIIYGKIVDEQKNGLSYATIRLLHQDSTFVSGTATDSLGYYKLQEIQSGEYLLYCSSVGYNSKIVTLEIEQEDINMNTIRLKKGTVSLEEVVITGKSFIRQNDKVLIIPEKQQVKHSHTGYDLLYNLMIPNINVDRHEGKVKTFGGEVTLYIDGRKADYREVQSLRPCDIEKVEYYDAPTGKYAMDVASINYITKQYKSGGYVSLDGKQLIGYLNGDYNASTKVVHGNTSYTIWAGHRIQKYDGEQNIGNEAYIFPDYEIQKRNETIAGNSKSNRQYIQANIESNTKERTLVGKIGFIKNAIPKQYQVLRTVYSGNYEHEDETYNSRNMIEIMPSIDLYGSFKIKNNQQLEIRTNCSYSSTQYERTYRENTFNSYTNISEDYYKIFGNLNYILQMKNQQSLAIQLYHIHNITSDDYSGDYNQYQQLWSGESLLFVEYGIRIGKKLSLNIGPGLSSLLYHVRGKDLQHNILPRLHFRSTYRPTEHQFINFSCAIGNSTPEYYTLNSAEQIIDSIRILRGNPDQTVAKLYTTRLGYSLQIGKVNVNINGSYGYVKDVFTPSYYIERDKIINSFQSNNNTHEISAMLGISWKVTPNLHIKATGYYMYVKFNGTMSWNHHMGMGSLQANYYWKSFGISAFFNTPVNMINISCEHTKSPIDYGLSAYWSHENWWVEAGAKSPFSKNLEKKQYMYTDPYYTFDRVQRDRTFQQWGWIKIAYTFDFGRKTARDRSRVNTEINSAIMKAN